MAQTSSGSGRGRKRRRNADNGFEVWGGYMSAKISKLDGQCKQDAGSDNKGIFSGIAIFVNGYTEPAAEELKRIMLSNGGTFHHYYSRQRTTHIIASNLPHTKVRHLNTDRIVKASWIVESLNAGRLLDYSKYLLYTKQSSVQPKISFPMTENPTHLSGCGNISSAGCSSVVSMKSESTVISSLDSETEMKNNGEVENYRSNASPVHGSSNTGVLKVESELVPNGTSHPVESESCGTDACMVNTKSELQTSPSTTANGYFRAQTTAQLESPGLCEPYDGDIFLDEEIPDVESCSTATSESSDVPSFKINANGESVDLPSCNKSSDGSDSKHPNQIISRDSENHEESQRKDLDLVKSAESSHDNLSTQDLQSNGSGMEDHQLQSESSNKIDGVEKSPGRNKNKVQSPLTDEKCEKSNSSINSSNQSFKLNSRPVATGAPTVEYDYPSNTSNPNFLSDFYNKSRLHHISTMGSMFKEYVMKLMKKPPDNSGKLRFKKWLEEHQHTCKDTDSKFEPTSSTEAYPKAQERLIMHIDMDCFFVSVGLRHRPDLVGQPVAVTHAKGNRANKRPGADINAEFQLYKDRQSKKKESRNVDTKIATKIRELEASSEIVARANDKDFASNDEGYEAWSDMDDEDESTLLQVLEQVEEKSCVDTTSGSNPSGITLEDASVDSSVSENAKKKAGKRGTSLLDSTSSLAEIASCSYEARQAGVSNGMFLGAALKLCPQLQTIPYDFEGYKEVSFQLYDIVASYTRSIEAVSCDELYADVSDVVRELRDSHGASPELLAACVRQHVTSVTKCGCSAGLGHSKLSARMATKLAKPHGHVYLDHPALLSHLTLLPLRDLPGVGWSVSDRLRRAGAETCGQLRTWSLPRLSDVCGPRTAATLLNFCNGVDDRPVNSHHVRKSVSAEVNYGIRFETELDAREFLRQLSEEVSNRLKAIDVIGRCLCLKLKIRCKDAPRETAKFMGHGVCDNVAKSVSLLQPTDDPQILLQEALKLLFQVKAAWCDFRGVGLQVSRLEAKKELSIPPASAITKFLVKKSKEEVSSDEQQPLKESSKTDQPPQEMKRASAMEKFLTASTNNSKSTENSKVVDVDVLLALPSDLREQVIAEYKQQGYIVPSLPKVSPRAQGLKESIEIETDSAVSIASHQNRGVNERTQSLSEIDLQKPGPSGYKAPRVQDADYSNDVVTAASNCSSSDARSMETPPASDDLPDVDNELANSSVNVSQIDSSFLCALPEDLQEELKRDYQRQKRVLNGLTSPQKLLNLSPSKEFAMTPPRGTHKGKQGGRNIQSPRRNSANHASSPPKRGRRRGRPPKWDTRRADTGRPASKAKARPPKETRAASPSDEVDASSIPSDTEPAAQAPSYSVPSLCGESSLPSVRRLIKEWLQACSVPNEEDCAILSEYFSDLAVAKQLEMMDCLIKLLYRKIGQLTAPSSSAWRAVFASMLEKLQPVMVREYGAPLQVCTFPGED